MSRAKKQNGAKRKGRFKQIFIFLLLLVFPGSLVLTACGENTPPEPQYEGVSAFSLGDIVLDEGTLLDKQQQNEAYLKSLDVDRLLYFYYTSAGLPVRNDVMPYGGWEAANTGSSVAGHTLGHYLSAVSMLYAVTNDAWYLETVNDIVAELEKCQKENGYVFSRPESDFDAVLAGRGDNGVLFYTVHKILAGLVDAYKYAGNETALEVAGSFTDWIYSKIGNMSEQQIASMLAVEYGGMNEVCYLLYEITGKEEHLKVAEAFNEQTYVKAWSEGVDNLARLHANTQIPKAAGFAKGYMVTGDKQLLDAALFFWDIVVNQRTFATGGNAENEHFGPAGITSDQLYYNPDETCNIYNMCKLSSYLYEITGEMKYADYLERAILNGIAGSIDEDGCKTYYQWLSPDAQKLFHSEHDSFWCCTGTGMESFAKLASMFAYQTEEGVRLNIFQSATYRCQGTEFTVENDGERNKITFVTGGPLKLELRVPYYAEYTLVQLNGVSQSTAPQDGYITIDRTFSAGDVIDYQIGFEVYTEATCDDEDVIAVKYGPYLLAAVGKRYEKRNYLTADQEALSNLKSALSVEGDGFVLRTGEDEIPMKRYCDITDETYTVYFQRVDQLPEEAKEPDLAMRARPFSDLGYTVTHSIKAGHNVWYNADGSCTYLEALNDGVISVDSSGKSEFSNDLFTFYVPYVQIPAGTHSIGYEFDEAVTVSSVSLYFYDNFAITKVPESYTVQYLDADGNWVDVANMSEATVKWDQFNTVTFDAVSTTRIRVVLTSGRQMGVIEMKVN